MESELALLVRAAAQGDEKAWEQLVERFTGLLWAVARAHRLPTSDAADVVQATWLRLLEHLDRIREPEHLGAWLATTARRECLRVLRGRETPVATQEEVVADDGADSPERTTLRHERDALVQRALTSVSPRCSQLLRVLMASPPPSYAEVSAALAMPVGSIGPTRARCLDCLRKASLRLGVEDAAVA